MSEGDKKVDAIDFNLKGEIKGNANNNNTKNNGEKNKNEITVQSANANVSGKAQLHNREVKGDEKNTEN